LILPACIMRSGVSGKPSSAPSTTAVHPAIGAKGARFAGHGPPRPTPVPQCTAIRTIQYGGSVRLVRATVGSHRMDSPGAGEIEEETGESRPREILHQGSFGRG
jgi:hypothetical protein